MIPISAISSSDRSNGVSVRRPADAYAGTVSQYEPSFSLSASVREITPHFPACCPERVDAGFGVASLNSLPVASSDAPAGLFCEAVFISRPLAIKLGLKKYFTGTACLRNHIAERRVGDSQCALCKPLKNSLHRAVNKKDISKVSAQRNYQKKYRAEHAAKKVPNFTVKDESLYDDVLLAIFDVMALAIYLGIPARRSAKEKKAPKPRKSAEEVRLTKRKSIDDWWKKNPLKRREYEATRRARRKSVSGRYTSSDVEDIKSLQKGKCAYCRTSIKRAFHVDHIVPVCKGGPNDRRNLQLLCAPCNMKKGAQDPIQFAQSLGGLL